MVQQISLQNVREGMDVYDSMGSRVGKIALVHQGAGQMADVTDTLTTKEFVDNILSCTTKLPSDVYPELYRVGFMRVGRGIARSDVIILPSQILDAGEETVFLKVPLRDLYNC
jgi:hypothetical protein